MKIEKLIFIMTTLEENEKQKYTTLTEEEVLNYVKVINEKSRKAKSDFIFNETNSGIATNQLIKIISEVVER